jgi:hypothetical protein
MTYLIIAYDLLDHSYAEVAEMMTATAANGLDVHSWEIFDNRMVVLYVRHSARAEGR